MVEKIKNNSQLAPLDKDTLSFKEKDKTKNGLSKSTIWGMGITAFIGLFAFAASKGKRIKRQLNNIENI